MNPKNEHELKLHVDIDVFYPDHPPRTESRVFLHTKTHWHDIGAVCRVCKTDKHIEIHHKFIEWADSDGVDWDKVKADHPSFDWSTFKEPYDFIDSIYNTEPLCLTPETLVLMANGKQKKIMDIAIGDMVIGHDGLAHKVTDVNITKSDGLIYIIDGIKSSRNHPFLTQDGWINAEDLSVGQIVYQFGMLFSQMIRLRSIKTKIFNSIINFISVYMVDSFRFCQFATDMKFHNVSMLKNKPLDTRRISYGHPHISFFSNRSAGYFFKKSGDAIQGNQSTIIGTKSLYSALSFIGIQKNWFPATFTRLYNFWFSEIRLSNLRTFFGACRISKINSLCYKKFSFANAANFLNSRFRLRTGWRPINHISSKIYDGVLYDITVQGCNSFVANRIVVHNCEKHHRAPAPHGIHFTPGPIHQMQQYKRDDFIYSLDEVNNGK